MGPCARQPQRRVLIQSVVAERFSHLSDRDQWTVLGNFTHRLTAESPDAFISVYRLCIWVAAQTWARMGAQDTRAGADRVPDSTAGFHRVLVGSIPFFFWVKNTEICVGV